MPSNRTPKGRSLRSRITPKAATIYRKVRRLHDEIDDEEIWLEQTRELRLDLHEMLGRYPWQTQVFDTTDEPEPPDWLTDEAKRRDWCEARALLVELERRLANPPGLV